MLVVKPQKNAAHEDLNVRLPRLACHTEPRAQIDNRGVGRANGKTVGGGRYLRSQLAMLQEQRRWRRQFDLRRPLQDHARTALKNHCQQTLLKCQLTARRQGSTGSRNRFVAPTHVVGLFNASNARKMCLVLVDAKMEEGC